MYVSQSRQKYISLILSVLLHLLLLVLLLYLRSQRGPLFTPEEVLEKRTSPAKISFQNQKAKPVRPAPIARPAAIPQPQSIQSAKAVDQNETQAPIALPSATAQTTVQKGITQTAEQPQQADAAHTGILEEPHANQGKNGTRASGSRSGARRSSISSAAFMNAFKQSVQTERQATVAGPSGHGSQSGIPQHVQERLDEWLYMNYKERAAKAIAKASHFQSKYIIPEKTFEKTIAIEIVIEKNGTLGPMPEKLSGIPEVDEFLLRIFKSADFPPIPARFNKNRFMLPFPLHISLTRGGLYYLQVG